MKNLLLFVFAIVLFESSFAQSNYEAVDRIAASVKATSIQDLHVRLVEGVATNEEKIRSFYYWIATTIRYDTKEAIRSFRSPYKQDPENVLKSGLAVCHGYSALFKELCDRSGIKCYLVSGFTKVNGRIDETGHTWNVVFVNDAWQLVDATWAAGGVNSQGKFVKQFSEKYFLVPADEFLIDHYPFDPMWQLKLLPVTWSNYKRATNLPKELQNFSFHDTIAAWESKDEVGRLLSSTQRMNAFNPGNKIIQQELAFALFESGNSEFEKGIDLLALLFPQSKSQQIKASGIQPGSPEFVQKLDSISYYFNRADSYYIKVKLDDANERTVLLNNRKSVKHNLEIINREKSKYKK
ncbi:MAG: hypothetical protein IPP71_01455 [Bacteroidetes bacterium]|nr:hypothetical protein [Bacteroidota bacterium]